MRQLLKYDVMPEMIVRTLLAMYCLVVGLLMFGMWSVLLFTNQVPELHDERKATEIKFHLTAEFLTATVLIAAGIGLFTRQKRGLHASLLAFGMLLYTIISEGLGYYTQRGETLMVSMFFILIVLTIIVIFVALLKSDQLAVHS